MKGHKKSECRKGQQVNGVFDDGSQSEEADVPVDVPSQDVQDETSDYAPSSGDEKQEDAPVEKPKDSSKELQARMKA